MILELDATDLIAAYEAGLVEGFMLGIEIVTPEVREDL